MDTPAVIPAKRYVFKDTATDKTVTVFGSEHAEYDTLLERAHDIMPSGDLLLAFVETTTKTERK